MNPLLGYGLISGIGGLASSLYNNFQGQKMSKELMDYQFQLQQQGIDKANLYNSPAEQMKRLAAAGLSPNLVYGNGVDGNQGTAASPSIASRKSEIANPFQEFSQNVQQAKLVDSQIKKNETENAFTAAKTLGQLLDNKYLDESMKDRLQLVAAKLGETLEQTNLFASQRSLNASKANEIEENIHLIEAKTGLTRAQIVSEKLQPSKIRAQIAEIKSKEKLNDRQRKFYDSLEKLNDAKIDELFAKETLEMNQADLAFEKTRWQRELNRLSFGDITPSSAMNMLMRIIIACLKD